jgi:CubicO group peptidase (beta-lactamase class C family)
MEAVGPAAQPYAWASVTKLLTALAALDGVQRGLLDLDEPAGPPGSTIRHLLAHASGLAFDSDAILAQPGRRRVYSNRGIEIVAEILAARSGQPFERLLADEICLPLGMAGTRLEGSPAWGAVGPLSDLMNLAVELASPSLIDEDLLARATQTVFPGLSGVLPGFGRQENCDWGLGFEIRDRKAPHWTGSNNSPRTFGHFGRSGSFLWVDPDAGLACVCLADRDFDDWAKQAWPKLSDDLLAAHAA